MENDRVVVALAQCGCAVHMRVLAMPERLRGKGELFRHNGFTVESRYQPGAYPNALCLRGTEKPYDLAASTTVFRTERDASDYVASAKGAIAALNAKIAAEQGASQSKPCELSTWVAMSTCAGFSFSKDVWAEMLTTMGVSFIDDRQDQPKVPVPDPIQWEVVQ